MAKKLKHDGLFKKIMINQIAAQNFLEYYLPADFKAMLDLSTIKVEKESYVEESLRQQFSDIVYSIQTKDRQTAYAYILLDHQSTIDHWIGLRLWKYALLLCERHKKNKEKLPLICPIILYNGKEVYNAPRNLWELFADPVQAKKLMSEDYQLVDLQSMSDDEIIYKKHFGMMEYMLKHIHQRDIIKLWENFLEKFKFELIIDRDQGYIYLKSFLWYTDSKLPVDRQQELERIITKYLSEEEKDNVMKTIAQKYIEEGEARGEARGKTEGQAELVRIMIKNGSSIEEIARMTRLSITKINELLKITA
jgi:predicted transposase/invertase (TIGR01784 family)